MCGRGVGGGRSAYKKLSRQHHHPWKKTRRTWRVTNWLTTGTSGRGTRPRASAEAVPLLDEPLMRAGHNRRRVVEVRRRQPAAPRLSSAAQERVRRVRAASPKHGGGVRRGHAGRPGAGSAAAQGQVNCSPGRGRGGRRWPAPIPGAGSVPGEVGSTAPLWRCPPEARSVTREPTPAVPAASVRASRSA